MIFVGENLYKRFRASLGKFGQIYVRMQIFANLQIFGEIYVRGRSCSRTEIKMHYMNFQIFVTRHLCKTAWDQSGGKVYQLFEL